ncbi:tyrosine-type recombinase/integrase [Saccharothrix australiensis]|uniref:Site-specific recombinase XerD n=1 Tax=Saccharothrix australiensis TaxID=2072 RepID=A0A495VUQ5_9PSEU|nr:tyrosine-type recombinase/integrase [Saccharothrix australiensis]RKT53072.1 site-specific recombinase XerD [Saccharothrix australiensis]
MSEKRRRFGRVRRLPSGRFQARYQGPDGKQHPAPETFEREKDAEQWLSTVETDIVRGDWTNPDAGKIELRTYAEAWIGERDLAVRTVELYRGLLRNHVGPKLGDVMLSDLSPARVRRWRKELLADGVGEVTVAKAYRFLRAVLNTASAPEERLLKHNPCTIKGGGREESPERPTASLDQVFAAADAIQARYRLVVLLATFGSLRFAEMVGLRRRDFSRVEDGGRTFYVVKVDRQTVQPDAGELFDDDPKAKGKRSVTLPPFLTEEIDRHLDVFVGEGSNAWVFLGPKGGRPKRNNFWNIWNAARTAAGMPDVHLHDLRHTGNTLAAETGATLRELMDRMGHSSTRAAMIYLHAREERGRKIAVGIEAMVKAAKGTPRAPRGTRGARKIKKGGKVVHLGRTARRLPAAEGESG